MARLLAVLLVFVIGGAAKELSTARPEEVGLSPERLARIRASMQRYLDRREIPGVVTLVARRGRVAHLEALGHMDVESAKPVRTDTIFRIASMTKPVTSVAAMMLFEEGRFLLSDPVSKFIPELKNPKVAVLPPRGQQTESAFLTVPAEREITIKDLMTHTAGLANGGGITADLYGKMVAERKPDDAIGDMVKRLAKLPLKYQPGSAWDYGPATDVLGYLVEVVSGMTLDRFFQERIFRPLGIEDTYFYVPEEKLARVASLYAPGDSGGLRRTAGPTPGSRRYFAGGGGLYSTAADYFRFHQMMLNGGELEGSRLLSRKSVELMTQNHIRDLPLWPALRGYRFGLGYRVRHDLGESGLPGSPGSYGWGGAFCTFFWVDPKEQMIGILMTQVRPYTHLNVRQEFQVVATAAIKD